MYHVHMTRYFMNASDGDDDGRQRILERSQSMAATSINAVPPAAVLSPPSRCHIGYKKQHYE